MKIDVDGPELDVLQSCAFLLSEYHLESVLVECSISSSLDPVKLFMMENGYVVDDYYEHLADHSTFRRQKEGIDVRNIVFSPC